MSHSSGRKSGLRILVCPSGFKGSLDPETAANCIEAGILSVMPDAQVTKIPLIDGGEGFTNTIIHNTGGKIHKVHVTGPIGKKVDSFFGTMEPRAPSTHGPTAILEMAAAAGLSLVPKTMRNPLLTTTFGVGELILSALDMGVRRILVGCGDSGTCDAGAGMLQALGARLHDSDGSIIPPASGGVALRRLSRVDLSGLDPRVGEADIEVAVNWQNVLCGTEGVAAIFGPQKGADENDVIALSQAMDNMAKVAADILGDDSVGISPGSGASGGLGIALRLIGATLRPRYDVATEYLFLDSFLKSSDLVITGEGGIDDQTPRGKMPAEIGQRAKALGVPVVAIAGTIGQGARRNHEVGIDAIACILRGPLSLDEAVRQAETLTTQSVEGVMRMICVGQQLR